MRQTPVGAPARTGVVLAAVVVALTALAVVLAGCSGSVRTTTVRPGDGSAGTAESASESPSPSPLDAGAGTSPTEHRTCPTPRDATDGQPQAIIDWVPFIKVSGRMFIQSSERSHPLDPALVGAEVARVRCHIADIVTDPRYRPQDGDASFLAVGTTIHRFGDANPDLRLAAEDQDGWAVYEATDVPGARTGAALLDIATTTAIELVDGDTGTRVLGRIDTAAQVRAIVDALLVAPVRTEQVDGSGTLEFVRFVLADGTAVQRPWDRSARVLGLRLTLPAALARLLPSP